MASIQGPQLGGSAHRVGLSPLCVCGGGGRGHLVLILVIQSEKTILGGEGKGMWPGVLGPPP